MTVDVIFSNIEENHLEILSGKFKNRLEIVSRILVEQFISSTIDHASGLLEEMNFKKAEIENFKCLDSFESSSHLVAEQVSINGKIIWNSKHTKIGKLHKV